MKHVLETVVSRFVTLYGEPRTDSAEALYSEYVRALKDWDRDALQAAVDEVVKNHTFPTWPTPGEVYKQARTEAARLYAMRPRPAPETEPQTRPDGRLEVSEEQRAHNRKLIEGLKRQVVVETWQSPTLPTPDRSFMQALQTEALRTADGRRRHLKDWHPKIEQSPDEAAE